MIKELIELINEEDKRNPLTDEQLAQLLCTNREKITEIRKEHNILNSRDRREKLLVKDAKSIIKKNPSISERGFLKELTSFGYKISRHVATRLKEELFNDNDYLMEIKEAKKDSDISKNKELKKTIESIKSFDRIIGSKGSLVMQIKQAKAAVMYPPNGLHTLILGPSGTGKSQMAEAMYKFAVESKYFSENAPFIVFNCADYSDNPQLLLSQLFGHVKGAFTGADSLKVGLVEKAHEGILFLDEVHRLPKEGQEILFHLLDNGSFRRLGEISDTRNVNVMIIAATTENPESSLLLTFRRRIPMFIELPPLKKRSYYERLKIIGYFFTNEATRIGKKIFVKLEVLRILLTYECQGNIGQLRSDIQVSCAKGLLNSIGNNRNSITINISDLSRHIRHLVLNINKRDPQIKNLVNNDMNFYPGKTAEYLRNKDRYLLSDDIYFFIEKRYIELRKEGHSLNHANTVIGKEIKKELEVFAKSVLNENFISKEELKGIVGIEIIDVVDEVFDLTRNSVRSIHKNFFYSLAIHLSATIDRINNGKEIINPQLDKVKSEYSYEYSIAKKITKLIQEKLGIILPDDEVGFIAMYIRTFSKEIENDSRKVGVLILTHGNIAKAMADVANKLLGVNHAIGIEMPLDESPKVILELAIKAVENLDDGKGCLLLVDMGSLVTFGEIITQRTGIRTKVVARVDTVMVLEAVRRSIMTDSDLDEIARELDGDKIYVGKGQSTSNCYPILKNCIVTVCITGEGTAVEIKNYLEKYIPNIKEKIEILTLGVLSEKELINKINEIRKNKNILAFVGTINPKVQKVPFVSLSDLLEGFGIKEIKNILGIEEKNPLQDIIEEDLVLTDLELYTKNEVLDYLIGLLEDKEYVNDNFMLEIYKREALSTTYAKGGIAIPHGFADNVTKPSVVIAKLKNPIVWENNKLVDLIFLIAHKPENKDILQNLAKLLINQNILKAIKSAKNSKEIIEVILS